jgi:hypothetical protein
MDDRGRSEPPAAVVTAVTDILSVAPRQWDLRYGGHTRAGKARAFLPDDTSVFVKWAEDDRSAALLDELRVLRVVRGSFLPLVVGWSVDPAVVIMEDLSAGVWPPPYPADIGPLWAALEAKAAVESPAGLPRLEDWAGSKHRWRRVGEHPEPFLDLGVVSEAWLRTHLEDLIVAEERVSLAGAQLVHNDVFSGNMTFVGGRAILIDWATAAVGNAWLDTAMAALSLRSEGGPPVRLGFPDECGFAALLAGHNALEAAAPLPDWARPDSTLRLEQLVDLRHALAWAAECLDLPGPDGPGALGPV